MGLREERSSTKRMRCLKTRPRIRDLTCLYLHGDKMRVQSCARISLRVRLWPGSPWTGFSPDPRKSRTIVHRPTIKANRPL